MSDVRSLPFDQYQRYRLVSDLLDQLRGRRRKPLHVLDVGGRTALLRRFLERDRITLVDVEPSEEGDLVIGNGGALPFQDNSFDAVTAFDTLEHVPPAHRAGFVAECQRVARNWVVLAGPYDAPRVAEAERLLQRFLQEKLGVRHRYLEEHRSYGLPDREAVEQQLASLGGSVASLGHANLDRWLVLMCLSLYLDEDPALRELAGGVHAFYNESLYASDHAEPTYRHVVVAAFDGARLPEAGTLLDPPLAPQGAIGAFGELTGELVAFDRERDAWRSERKDLQQTIDDLREDLAGHRESLTEERELSGEQLAKIADLERDLEVARRDHEQVVATFEADLVEHRSSVAELERTLEAGRADHEAIRAELEAEIEGHRSSVETLEREMADAERGRQELLDAHRADVEAHRATIEELRGELAEHAEQAARMTEDTERQREAIAALEASALADRESAEAELVRRQEAQAALVAELEGVRAEAREIEAALVAANGAASGLNETLLAREAELHEARLEIAARGVELRSRWRNLKRAFAWRKPAY